MPYQTGNRPDGPEGNAPGALESAARNLRATPQPAGSSPLRSREFFRRRQERDLLAWAEQSRGLISPSEYLPLICDAGEEHPVWVPEDQTRHFKVTHPGWCGFTVVIGAETSFDAELTGALPLEYREHLLLQNSLNGDRVSLEGVAREGNQLVIVTSQPTPLGGPVSQSEMLAFMAKLWFQPLTTLTLGHPGALAFCRDLDETAAFDAHPRNFVKDNNGVVLPIDLILVRADEPLQKALQAHLN